MAPAARAKKKSQPTMPAKSSLRFGCRSRSARSSAARFAAWGSAAMACALASVGRAHRLFPAPSTRRCACGAAIHGVMKVGIAPDWHGIEKGEQLEAFGQGGDFGRIGVADEDRDSEEVRAGEQAFDFETDVVGGFVEAKLAVGTLHVDPARADDDQADTGRGEAVLNVLPKVHAAGDRVHITEDGLFPKLGDETVVNAPDDVGAVRAVVADEDGAGRGWRGRRRHGGEQG